MLQCWISMWDPDILCIMRSRSSDIRPLCKCWSCNNYIPVKQHKPKKILMLWVISNMLEQDATEAGVWRFDSALSTSLNSLTLKSLDVFEYLSDAVSSKTRQQHVVMVTPLNRKFLCYLNPLKPFLEPVILIAGSRGPPRWTWSSRVRKFSQESD